MQVITFSGLDGCGKSTQVALTCAFLARRGVRVYRLVSLYGSITGAWTLLREARRRRVRQTKGAAEVGHGSGPLVRTYPDGRTFDEDRRRLIVRLRRWLAYPLDCCVLSLWMLVVRLCGYSAVVCDRYVFDKMVNLPDPDCVLSRLMCRLTPRPDHAFLLDIPPQVAQSRRNEHPEDYYITKHDGYQKVVQSSDGLKALCASSIEETQKQIQELIGTATAAGFAD